MTNDQLASEEFDVDTTTLDTNTGGRVRFEKDMPVRILELDGTISAIVYTVDQERSDRKGLIQVREQNSTRMVRVHHRRVFPLSIEGKAVVVESGDKFWALCPDCGRVTAIEPGDVAINCPACSKTHSVHWLGVKPMADATTTDKAEKVKPPKAPKPDKAAAPKAEKAPKPEKEPKVVKEPVKIDVAALAKLKDCELWTKGNVKFDHERIDVQAHVLLFVGSNPRKLCFNTYNSDLDKARTKLQKDGYVRQ
jgi:hypothetical protein